MRLLQYVALAALSCLALAAKKGDNVSIYDKYSKKHASSAPLELDEKAYADLTISPRDYSVSILLTARDARFGCKTCKEFDPEWKVIASSWKKGDSKGQHRMLFATLDFDKGRNVFMQLQLSTAPVLMVFPANKGENAKAVGEATAARYDFLGSTTATQINDFIKRQLPAGDYPDIVYPFNYGRFVTVITIVIGLITSVTVAYPYLVPVVQNRNVWAAVSLILVLMFTSGHMYNHIRKVPYVAGDGKGGIQYFAGGFGNQYGMETQIVAAIYAVLSFALIALALKVPRMGDAKQQQVAVVIWAAVLFGMYSFLMSVFRFKNGGYPFWLPPF